MAIVDFYFDPVCPWAWITSRWVREVAPLRDLDVQWRFIALRIVNEAKDYERDFPAGYPLVHGAGRTMLQVAAAIRAVAGNEGVGRFYTEVGTRLHNERRSAELRDGNLAVLTDALAAGGFDPALAVTAPDDPALDALVRAETEDALARAGKDLGTPIVTFEPGDPAETTFFGPVLSRIPRGDEAARIWDAIVVLARTPGMCELKRSIRHRPDFG